MTDRGFQITSQKTVYENRWMRVREDCIVRPNGAQGLYGVVEKSNFAVVAALQDGRITLVRQYRYPVGGEFWEMPQGASSTGETNLEQVAREELREEAGLVATHLVRLGRLFPAYGYASVAFELFVATGLSQTAAEPEPEEHGMEARTFALGEFVQMVKSNEIQDAATVAACCLLLLSGHIAMP